jgi:hAT family C-terminal dimerisation region
MIIFQGKKIGNVKQSTNTPSFQEEIAHYKALKILAYRCTPLQFWKDHTKEYPVMAVTARRMFCISASSAPSERDFSSVGHTITDAVHCCRLGI